MRCPDCAYQNSSTARFCENCGTALINHCPKCGEPARIDAHYCGFCGHAFIQSPQLHSPLIAARPAEPKIPVVDEFGEGSEYHASVKINASADPREKPKQKSTLNDGARKIVTILFADIVGSTSIAERLDPEEWKEIVTGAHKHMAEAIYRYGGTIAQLQGDGVLAFFGAPITHEDDPLRAVRAGLDIQQSIHHYEQNLHGYIDRFQVRIGIHTGAVVVGLIGDELHREYLAIGDAVNLAARLQSEARAGRVLVSETTARLVKDRYGLNPLGKRVLKGKSKPVHVFEVQAPIQGIAPNHHPARFSSPLVGRQNELSGLSKAFSALQTGSGQIVLVSGEAGIGKSRLVEEARNVMVDSGKLPGFCWLTGRALSYGTTLSYWTIIQLIKDDLCLSDGDPETRIKVSLRRRVKELMAEDSGEIIPYLFHLLGAELEGAPAQQLSALDGETRKFHLKIAIREYFRGLSLLKPLVLVFEDFHWADPSTLAAVESLMALTDRHRIMLLLLMRPERDHGSWRIKLQAETDYEHRYTEIVLKPLSQDEQDRMVVNLTQSVNFPDHLRQLILDRSEGNPLFIEELVQSLMEQEVLDTAAGQSQIMKPIPDPAIPETLIGLLLARIDRLSDELRRTLQLASVIGKSFLYKILEAICQDQKLLDDQLAQLQRLDLIKERTRQPELEYIFKHSLTQEAAYLTLRVDQRKEMHFLVAQALENIFPERTQEFCGFLAYHYLNSGQIQNAAAYLFLAGRNAMDRGAYLEASQNLSQALPLFQGEDEERRWQILLDLDEIYGILGDQEERLMIIQHILEIAQASGDEHRIAEAFYHKASYESMKGQFGLELESHLRSLAAAKRSGNKRIEALVYGMMTICYSNLGELKRAEQSAKNALRSARKLSNKAILVRNLNNVAVFYQNSGDHARSIQILQEHVSINRRLSNQYGEALGLLNLGFSYTSLGLFQLAVESLQRSIEILEKMEAQRMLSYGQVKPGVMSASDR